MRTIVLATLIASCAPMPSSDVADTGSTPDAVQSDASPACPHGLVDRGGECSADPSVRWVVTVASLSASGLNGVRAGWRVCVGTACLAAAETEDHRNVRLSPASLPSQAPGAFMPALELVVSDALRATPEVCRVRVAWSDIDRAGLACIGQCAAECTGAGTTVTLSLGYAPE